MMLIEHLTGLSIGVDLTRGDVLSSPTNPAPGRVSPNACISFLLAGIAFWLLWRGHLSRLVLFLSGLCTAIGVTALVGYFLHLKVLYQLANHNRLIAPTAIAVTVLGIAVWMAQRETVGRGTSTTPLSGHQIVWRALSVVAVVTVISSLFSFSVMRETFESTLVKNMQLVT